MIAPPEAPSTVLGTAGTAGQGHKGNPTVGDAVGKAQNMGQVTGGFQEK